MSESEKLGRGRACVEDAFRMSRKEFLKLGVAGVVGSFSLLFFGAAGCAGASDGEGTDSGEEDDGGGGY